MKNIFLTICIAASFLLATNTNAQNTKIAHFDINYVLPLLPKFKKAENDMKSYSKQIEDELKNKQKEFETKYTEYQQNAPKLEPAILRAKQEELQSLEKQIVEFEQKAQADVQEQQAKLLAPIYDEVEKTVKDVANTNGYNHVFRTDACSFGGKSVNISDLVLKKLGVTPPVSVGNK